MRYKGLLLLAAALLVAGAFLLFARQIAAMHSGQSANANAKPVASDDTGVDATAEAVTQSTPPRKSGAVGMTDPYARYDAATDLFPLAQELRERAERGDIDVVAALAELEDECMMFVLSHGDRSYIPRIVGQRDPSIKPWLDAMLERTNSRCQRFTRSDLMRREQIHDLLVAAAKQGSPSAKARLLVGTVDMQHMPDDVLAGTVHDILTSGNPAAFADLSAVMGARVQGREQLFDVPSGSESASYAYLFAACQLGLDCGPNSRILTNLCFNGIGCGYPSIQALMQDTMLTPDQYRSMQQDVQQILAKIPHH